MPRILDQNKPYAEVHGGLGAMFEQGGVLFKANGSEASSGDVEHIIDEIAVADDNEPLSVVFCIEQKSESADPIDQSITAGRDLDSMHWRHLKSLVEIYGGIWTNKEQAIAFLKGKE